jgi:hypothetical protein
MPFAIDKCLKTKIAPYGIPSPLHSAGNTECGMLVWDDVIFVFRVRGLVLRCHVDVFDW